MRFKHIQGDTCSDDGLWIARDPCSVWKERWAIIELEYSVEHGKDFERDHGTYFVTAGYVVWDDRKDAHVTMALRSCGYYTDTMGVSDESRGNLVAVKGYPEEAHVIASCLWSYGEKERVFQGGSNNRRKLIQAARGAL